MSVRVLAVSDSHFERSLLLSVLPSAHCEISLVDGPAAVKVSMAASPPDVLVMTSSFAFTVGQAFLETFNVPLLLLSRRQTHKDETTRYAACQSVVTAPFDRAKLLVAIKTLAARVATQEASAPVDDPHAELRERVDGFFQRIASLTHYSVLGVAPDAKSSEIMLAYRTRMLEFHPDRMSATHDVLIQEQAVIISKRINQAFQTLSRPDARATYDATLSATTDPGVSLAAGANGNRQ